MHLITGGCSTTTHFRLITTRNDFRGAKTSQNYCQIFPKGKDMVSFLHFLPVCNSDFSDNFDFRANKSKVECGYRFCLRAYD